MPEIRVARRYTSALFALARQENQIDRVERDLFEIGELLSRLPKLHEMLDHPVIPAETKKRMLRDAFSGALSDLTLHFLDLLIDKRRTEILSAVPPEFHAMANADRGVVEAQVLSAVPLAADQEAQLASRLTELTGKRVKLAPALDASLIGGLLVKIGDTVIDGSVKGQLEQLREQLATG